MTRRLLSTVLCLAAVLGCAPGRAAPSACLASAAQPNGKCSFIASGPIEYASAGGSGWYIQVFRGTNVTTTREGDGGWPQTGVIATQAGDNVIVGTTGPGGLVVAGSELPAAFPHVTHGCVAGGVDTNVSVIQCKYVAEGPGTWLAATTWPYHIKASSNGGATWRNLVYQPNFGVPGSGTLATSAGDVVVVSITCWNAGDACVAGQIGGQTYYEGTRAGAVLAMDA